MILAAGLSVPRGEVWSGVVSTLVIVVLDVEVDQLAEVYPQSAARVVDVLSVQRLEEDKELSEIARDPDSYLPISVTSSPV